MPPKDRLKQEILKWGNRLLFALNAVFLGGALFFICTRGVEPAPTGWTYSELITTLLAAIGVLLAVVALFVALLAIWGYSALKHEASVIALSKAQEVAEKVAREVAGTIAARSGIEAVEPDEGSELSDAMKGA